VVKRLSRPRSLAPKFTQLIDTIRPSASVRPPAPVRPSASRLAAPTYIRWCVLQHTVRLTRRSHTRLAKRGHVSV
jgi:hypothetical protein